MEIKWTFFRDNRELKGKQLRVELGNGGRKKRTEGCFTCGSLDHIARDCDKNPSRDEKVYVNKYPNDSLFFS